MNHSPFSLPRSPELVIAEVVVGDVETLEAGEDGLMSYEENTDYPIINIDQDDGGNEVSDLFNNDK